MPAVTVEEAHAVLIEIWCVAREYEHPFNHWYDEAYMPSRLELRGFLSARRYGELGDGRVSMAAFEMTSSEVVVRDDYRRLRRSISPDEFEMVKHLSRLEHRVYEVTSSRYAAGMTLANAPGLVLGCNWWEPIEGMDDDLNQWYEKEHIPLVLSVPGWIRSRRLVQTKGRGPRYLAMHEISSTSVFTEPIHRAANETRWHNQVIEEREQYERHGFELKCALPAHESPGGPK